MGASAKKPIFLRHFLRIFVSTFLLVCLGIFSFDIPLAYAMTALPDAVKIFYQGVQILFGPSINYTLWPLAFFFVKIYTKKKRLANFLLEIAISVPLANLLASILKFFFGRARPELLFSMNEYGFFFFKIDFQHGSFPSGHAAIIGAIAGLLSCYYPRKTAIIVAVALLLSFCRVATGFHFFSDILAGLFIGLTAAQWVYTKLQGKLYNLTL